eukprot:6620830-Alexandrium_andersonii.AAC.1
MAEDAADFSPSRSRSRSLAADGAGSAALPRSDDESDRSPTWRELREEGMRAPAVLKPGRKSNNRGHRRRGHGARSSHSKPPH